MAKTADEKIAVVGGGIAGLFCALILARDNKKVFLFEASERLGGRIRTIRLDKNNQPLDKDTWKESGKLEFYVEFGPMRVELDKQLLLKALLKHLEIKAKPTGGARADEACLVEFPAYASPTSAHDPQYDLRPEEVGKTPLELLRTALLRIIVHLEVDGQSDFAAEKEKLIRWITLAAAVQEPVDPIFAEWMKRLNEGHYWEIQTRGRVEGVSLYAMGFWNLLSDYLSHDAITKLRDLGTFYHLLPENPNAAEWLVWWLLGFAISEQLQGVFGGMECIIDKLTEKLDKEVGLGHDRLIKNCWVTELEKTGSKLKLGFDPKHKPSAEVARQEYDRVILALPKSALEKIARQSKDAFAPEPDIADQSKDAFAAEPDILQLLDSAFGFPMVKTFVIVKSRWWEGNRANRYATRVPTRELHYWPALTSDSKQGLIMAYTDRPASSFWANYVPPGPQLDAARSRTDGDPSELESPLPESIKNRLVKKVVRYLNDNDLPDIRREDIVWYGIRDWGRAPYGGANHAWRPERKYWVVMRRLAHIAEHDGTGMPSIHICGEAYSDYHGFMEGSLRSAVYVLHRILDKNPDGTFAPLPWLVHENVPADPPGAALRVNKAYLAALRTWAANLDAVERTALYYDEQKAKKCDAEPASEVT